MKLRKKSTLGKLLLLGCTASACMVESGDNTPSDAPEETVGVATEAFNPADGNQDPTDINLMKGHIQITKKALALLAQRNLLPVQLQDPANQKLLVYGVNFADHPWLGRPEAPFKEVPNRMSQSLGPGTTKKTLQFAKSSATYSTNVESFWLAPDPTLNLTGTTDITWLPGTDTKDFKPNPNYALMYNQRLHVNVDINDVQQATALALLGPFFPSSLNDTDKDIVRRFAVDNLFHYSLGDIVDIAPAPLAANASSIMLYPLTKEYCATILGKAYGDLNDESKDACTKTANVLNNQAILSGVDFGATKYGAMLYQLARKFFVGSAAEPSLSELQKAGNDVPGWHTGYASGSGGLAKVQIKNFPHTYLGGNPHVCSGSTAADPCATGKPTWPAWVPDSAPTSTTLTSMEVTKPGRKDRAALIYLGWALHMVEDQAVPVHAGNWTGPEHDNQDNLADRPEYYNYTSGKSQWLMDSYMKDAADQVFGNSSAPKNRDQICQNLNIVDSQLVAGSLNWAAVRPTFLDTAKTAYSQRQATIAPQDEEAAGASYVKNAVMGAMKLLLCSTPSTGYWPTTAASGFVWSGSGGGTYPAPSLYSYNSSNTSNPSAVNTITMLSTGSYRVDFPNLGLEIGGNVQVTAYGGDSTRCKVGGWSSGGGPVSAYVYCHDKNGVLTNSAFTASYVRKPGPSRSVQGGYLWADQPSAASYTPSTYYQWNGTGARNTVTRNGVGNYQANFPGLNVNGGTVEVTAYGSGSEYCKVGYWGNNVVNVNCYNYAGAPVDTLFTLNFTDQSPNGTPSYHYAWADQPTAANYTPSTYYQHGVLASECASAGTMTMSRSSVGSYVANIPALSATGSNVKVTAYGGTADTCKVTGWWGSSTNSQVGVACFDTAGNPVDSYFALVYSTSQWIIC